MSPKGHPVQLVTPEEPVMGWAGVTSGVYPRPHVCGTGRAAPLPLPSGHHSIYPLPMANPAQGGEIFIALARDFGFCFLELTRCHVFWRGRGSGHIGAVLCPAPGHPTTCRHLPQHQKC